jgi:rhamnogalacturonyl hydrolase YesR
MNPKKLLFFILFVACRVVYAETPQEFKNFPAGREPGFIGQRIAQRYINRNVPYPEDKTGTIAYPEVCTWFGALRFAEATLDDEMLYQLERNMTFILNTRPNLAPSPNHVDNTVFAVVPLQLYLQTGTPAYRTFGLDYANRQWTMPSNPSSSDREKYQALLSKGLSWQTRFWVDDMYMITAIQSRAYLASGNDVYISRAAHEMIAYIDSIQQPNGLLFHHAETAPFFWGRGNGWMAAGMADLLSHLPESNSNRPRILQEYRKMMATLKSYQNAEGLWNQLIDNSEAWTETSGSAMFAYAMATGVKKGWLDAAEYAPVVRKAWLGLLTYLNDEAALRNVCVGTNIGTTTQYYLDRPRSTGDLHGQAALLWLAVALYDTTDNSAAGLTSLAYGNGTLSPAFNPEITEYTCYLPAGTGSATPVLTTTYGAGVTGAGAVDVSSGAGTASIAVTSIDGTTTKTYTVNFVTGNGADYTHLIINNDFELAYDAACNPVPVTSGMDGWSNNAWRPKNSSCAQKQFYGWTCNLSLTGSSTSQGINADGNGKHGDWVCWIGGDRSSYTEFEFSQTIDKNSLPAGTYRLQCLLAVGADNKKNTQRLFANSSVQYYGSPSDYIANLAPGEKYTFAGHTSFTESSLKEMALYVSINDNEALKIGVRTSNRLGNGTLVAQQSPMFKTDYFRLAKINDACAVDATLANIALSAGNISFSPQELDYNVQLPVGTETVTATATANIQDATVVGAGTVDVSSGAGVSTIVVTALDGTTTKTYTLNYTVESGVSAISEVKIKPAYFVLNRKLTVKEAVPYDVYSLNGMKVAAVRTNLPKASVDLCPGVYIVKTKNAEVFKVLVK